MGVAIDGTPCRGCGCPVTARSMIVASVVGGWDEEEGTGAGRGEGDGEREWGSSVEEGPGGWRGGGGWGWEVGGWGTGR